MSISIVILAAGKGTRMKSTIPKVLHEISGKPMLFHAIDAAQKISDDITVVLYHHAEEIQRRIEKTYGLFLKNIHFHIQDVDRYPGTGGAMHGIAIKHKKVLILNGDMPLVTEASLHSLAKAKGDINMSVITLEHPSGYGRVIIVDGEVREIVEEKDCIPAQKEIKSVNAGVYCVKKELLDRYIPKLDNHNAQEEYYLTDIIKMAVQDKKIVQPVFVKEEEFKGVNSKLDLAKAEEIMQDRIKRAWMQEGITMHLPQTIYIDARVKFEGESILDNGVTLHGDTKIIASHIKSHSIIESSHIDHSTVGPMARIRPGTKLTESHIGNFVEVKNSTLKGVKAGHLAYLGDATIEEGTNIGAGVITCNYDGKAKHPTKIGKYVFVGSDTQLVAPVTIEDNVIIAAGTTVTKDVAQGELAISRAPLKRVKDFFYKFFREA